MKKTVWLLILWCALLVVPSLEAFSKEDLVQPYRMDIDLCKEVLGEIGRQGEQRLKEIEEWKAYYEGCTKELAANIQHLKAEQTRRQEADNKISSAHGSLSLDDKGNAHVPHHGWGLPGQIQERKQETNRVIAEENATVGKGEMAFHFAGTGWLNENQLKDIISNHAKQITDLQSQIQAGEFSIHFPGVGWINKKQTEARMADNEKKISETLAVIEKGEYALNIPHLGWINRNQLQAQIKAAEDELAKLRESLAKEDLSLNRPLLGWSTLAQLHGNMEAKKKAIADLETSVGALEFSHNIPTLGWVTGKNLKDSIEGMEKEIANVQKLLSEKKYSVPLSTGGWADANAINESLKAPKIDPAVRAALNKGLSHIPTAAQTDVAIRQLEVNKRKTWLGAIGSHAGILIEKFKLELSQLAILQSEYASEVALNQKRIDRHIAWLKQNLTLFP